MTPEHTQTHSQTDAEKLPLTPRQNEVALISRSLDIMNADQRLSVMRRFLDGIYDEAEQGLLKSRRGEVYTPDRITEQLVAAAREINYPIDKDLDPMTLIPSAGNIREAADTFISKESTSDAFLAAILERAPLPLLLEPRIRAVGGNILDRVGVIEPMPPTNPFDALPKEIQLEIHSYNQIKESIRQAEREGDYAFKASEQRDLVYRRKMMSPQARAYLGL